MRSVRWRVSVVLIAFLIGAAAFVYRFNTLGGPLAGFDNEHFFLLVRAEAMLDGELPLRDYADTELRSLWPPLSYATSAIAMQAGGRSLLSEAVMTVGLLAVGAALVFWAAATFAQAIWPAVLTTVVAVALGPTLYNYPKITPYAFAVVAMLAYARRPDAWRLLFLAAVVAVATLYRHDHGVYLGVSVAVLILLVNGRRAARPLLACAALVLAGLTPGIVFAQQHGGFLSYLRECLTLSRREVSRTVSGGARFQVDWSQPLLARVPPAEPPPPRIAVRWADTITADQRVQAEQELALLDRSPRGDERNWSYVIDDPSHERLGRIVQDARVADTDGIDRREFVITAAAPPPPPRGGVFGWVVAPGVLRAGNAVPWLRLIAWSVVIVSIGCVAWAPLRRAVAHPAVPLSVVAALAVLGALLCLVFLRNIAAYRLPDVAVPIAVLGAWVLAATARATQAAPVAVRVTVAMMLAVVVGLTVFSAAVVDAAPEQVRATGIGAGPVGLENRSREVRDVLAALPASMNAIDQKLAGAAAYLGRCTRPSDRLLVADYVPELYYFARRGIAAGQMVFFGGFYTSTDAQRATIDRWSGQSVPIALVQPAERFSSEFGGDYPQLAEYLRTHYERAGQLEVREGLPLDVWVAAAQPGRTDTETGLPCFDAR
ncbi:MAG: hypothetical protein FJW14_02650 [Acidimicrobiia bacterium]|nr:hypothetical protein [Acidimicrobiia bacterium]